MVQQCPQSAQNCSLLGCKYKTRTEEQLKNHRRRHNLPEISCNIKGCRYTSKCKTKMQRHIDGRHNSSRKKKIECPLCPNMFYTLESMQGHVRIHTNEKAWRCSLCRSEFAVEDGLRQHRVSVHGESVKFKEYPKLKCELCPFTTNFPDRLTRHLSVHCTDRPYLCTYTGCKYRGKRKDALKNHQTSIPQAGTYRLC